MQDKLKELLEGKIVAVNAGLDIFAEELEKQGVETIRVRFTPRASKLKKTFKIYLMP